MVATNIVFIISTVSAIFVLMAAKARNSSKYEHIDSRYVYK